MVSLLEMKHWTSKSYTLVVVSFWLMFGGDQQIAANVTEPSKELLSFHRVAIVVLQLTHGQNDVYQVQKLFVKIITII